MTFGNRKEVMDWLNGHQGEVILLEAQGSTLKVIGRSGGVDEIDACSTNIYECELATGLPGIQVAVSLHDENLALHVLGNRPDGGEVVCSLPITVPYGQVRLSSV